MKKFKFLLLTICSFNLWALVDIQELSKKLNYPLKELEKTIKKWEDLSRLEYKSWKGYYHIMPYIINKNNLKRGCEIGVATGNHSLEILKKTFINKLYSIDPYLSYNDPTNYTITYSLQKEHDILFLLVQDKLSNFGSRSELIRKKSVEAANMFDQNSLDFVFLDGNHTYEYVMQDLEAWYDKIRSGGFFIGDDYATAWPGVPQAVNEFFGKKKIKVNLYPKHSRIWWIIKP